MRELGFLIALEAIFQTDYLKYGTGTDSLINRAACWNGLCGAAAMMGLAPEIAVALISAAEPVLSELN